MRFLQQAAIGFFAAFILSFSSITLAADDGAKVVYHVDFKIQLVIPRP